MQYDRALGLWGSTIGRVVPRLIVPIVLLAICIASLVAAGRLGSEPDESAVAANIETVDTPVLSARRLPEQLTVPIANDELFGELSGVVAAMPSLSCLVVTEGDDTLFEHNADFALTPAGSMKMLIAYAMLSTVGPDYRYTTQLLAESVPTDGVISGDLVLVGSGDPVLMTADYARSFADQPMARTPIEDLADAAVAAGITQVTGGVVGVETRYDDERYPDSWPSSFSNDALSGPLSALMINDGFTSYPTSVIERDTGEIASTAAADPVKSAAALFDDLLEAQDVVIAASSKNVSGRDISELTQIAEIESPPMRDIIRQMFVYDDNTTAELLTRELGLTVNEDGSTDGGTKAIVDVLKANGLPDFVEPRDGSGLDPANTVTCSFLAQLMASAGPSSGLAAALPVSGADGSLRGRFIGTSADGKVHAASGLLDGLTALVGYVEADDGHFLEFSYIVNDEEGGDTTALLRPQTRMAVALAEYPVGPSAEEIAPQDATVTDGEVVIGGDVDAEGPDAGGAEGDGSEGDEAPATDGGDGG